jgi:hypothetical protein
VYSNATLPLPKDGTRPRRTHRLGGSFATATAGEHGNESRKLLSSRLTAHYPQQRACGSLFDGLGLCHSGMFPCFLAGNDSRLLRSCRSAWMTSLRVSLGAMTASTKPRSAAM